ncbi:phospholipase A2 inhibitor and Ly6/PLAUR domain-containing protein-like [Conger conger]|uniref:phospholipase A2 inhibitor and Ly6/PLAUR domain-containing protein-like n=1 Tax=Conger conger TaxID=82655 RepID=UPI002A59A7C6|nr:phospholipase A2 inhibitor and Ly6/PLAUR domain-containing protein-like [Conger conger]
MKLLVTIALTCALFSKAYPLDCFECAATGTGPCLQTTRTCQASQTKCTSYTTAVTLVGIQTTTKVKSCTTPDQCFSGSVNSGISMTTVNTQCCESNRCNDQEPPALPESSTNGKKCFTCAASGDCTSTLECKGSEDRCFTFTAPAIGKTKGCTSQSFCSAPIPQLEVIGNLNCCEGNLCNNALHIGQTILFLLLVPLASFFLFN